MKSVLESLLAREEPGPFLLELFDSSEYSLVVPGEGPLPESNPATWLSGTGQGLVTMDGEGRQFHQTKMSLRPLQPG